MITGVGEGYSQQPEIKLVKPEEPDTDSKSIATTDKPVTGRVLSVGWSMAGLATLVAIFIIHKKSK